MPRLLDRYVLREVVPPFLVGLLLVVFVLLMNQVLLLAELFIDKGVPALEALRLLGLLVPSILVFALPMAVLMGVLGGLARLSADSEIVALQALGVGPRRLGRPILLFGLGGALLTLPLALFWAPRANNAWVRAMTGSVIGRVQFEVRPLEFNETIPGLVFIALDVDRDGTWREVFAYLGRDPGRFRFVQARSGRVRLFPAERRAVLELVDGTAYAGSLDAPGDDTVTAFDRLEEEIDVSGLFPALAAEKRVREKDIGELVRDLEALEAAPADESGSRQARAHRIEIHKKMALPAACLVFAFLGLPLGIMVGRTGRTGGFSLGLVLIFLYYILITAGERAAMNGRLSAPAGMWGANALLAVAAAWLLLRRPRRAAGAVPSPRAGRPDATPDRRGAAADDAPPGRPGRLRPLPFRFPGLVDRYIARKFLAILAFVLTAFAAVAFLFVFLETLDEVRYAGKPAGLAARYALAKLPEFLAFVLPVSVLAAALLALGLLARTNEATALKACGVSAYRTSMPVLVLAAAASLAAVLVQERLVPASRARAEAAWAELQDLPARRSSFLNRNWVLGGYAQRIYHFGYFEPRGASFGRLSVFEFREHRVSGGEGFVTSPPRPRVVVSRTFAETAAFEGHDLVYRNGWTRDYSAGPGPALSRAATGRIDVSDDLAVFRTPWREPLRMTYGELRRYTEDVRRMGFPAARLRAALAAKTALPFVSLIMALLAVPFGFRMGRKGTLVGVGVAAAVAMAYWGAFAGFRSLGAAGVLTPFLGAWGANLIFGLAGIVGLFRLRT